MQWQYSTDPSSCDLKITRKGEESDEKKLANIADQCEEVCMYGPKTWQHGKIK